MKKKNIAVISIFIILFLAIGFSVKNTSEGILFDKIILDMIHREANPILFPLMEIISFMGSAYILLPSMILITVYTIYRKKYHALKLLTMSTLGSYLANIFLKNIFTRTRPLDYFLVEQPGLSYPSGHSMVAMTFYMTLAYIISKSIKNKQKKKFIYFLASSIILLMGISRLYLGVHWPTDIIGGFLAGYIFFYATINLFNKNT